MQMRQMWDLMADHAAADAGGGIGGLQHMVKAPLWDP